MLNGLPNHGEVSIVIEDTGVNFPIAPPSLLLVLNVNRKNFMGIIIRG